jgi:hypothetical protein
VKALEAHGEALNGLALAIELRLESARLCGVLVVHACKLALVRLLAPPQLSAVQLSNLA